LQGSLFGRLTRHLLDIINLEGAPNDDITYLGVTLNSTISTVDNLMGIFRKFVTTDLAQKACRERELRLEGKPLNLTILQQSRFFWKHHSR
jgi:adenylate cyclase